MRTGYIGLGNIGAPMAARLAEATDCVVHDAVATAAARFEGKAEWLDSPAEIGRVADLVGICVRDDDDVRAVVAGPDGLLQTMRGGLIAIHSTIPPASAIDLAARAAAHGVVLIDAAVTGGPDAAARGGLTAMVGGAADAVAEADPLLRAYCSSIVHAGATGSGMALKICNNLVTYIELSAALESYRLAAALGLDPALLTRVMSENGNLTPSMRKFVEFRDAGAALMGADGFRRAQEALVHLGEKDLALAVEVAGATGTAIATGAQLRTNFARIIMEGIDA